VPSNSDGVAIGDRMKRQYEDRTDYALPRRTYTIVRVDGRAFHTLTKPLKRPFDYDFIAMMDSTALCMCREMAGAQIAYVQSDEISVLLTDFTTILTDAWFDASLRKMCSVSASIATAWFNLYWTENGHKPLATFDSRAFTIPDPIEVENYFIWRQQDWTRNSIQMVARHHYSHKQLHGKNVKDMQEMIHKKDDNWAQYHSRAKNGRFLWREEEGWASQSDMIFTQNREELRKRIPTIEIS